MVVAYRQALPDDRAFCRSTHHLAYHDVVVSQFGPWDERRQDEFFDAKWNDGNIDILLVDEEPCGFAVVSDEADHLRVVELVIHPKFLRNVIAAIPDHKNHQQRLYESEHSGLQYFLKQDPGSERHEPDLDVVLRAYRLAQP